MLTTLRSRFRKWPCRIGWHARVLSFVNTTEYRRICEHCGR